MESKLESFYIIDSETLALNDNSVVMDFSVVFVNMKKLLEESDSVMPFIDFYNSKAVKKITVHPSIAEQKQKGFLVDRNTVEFWQNELSKANDSFKSYINRMLSGTKSINDTVFEISLFIKGCINDLDPSVQNLDNVYCLERSGGFDTNKFFNFFNHSDYSIKECPIKYWNRREIRTIISCNKYRIPEELLKPNTTIWSNAIVELINKDMKGEFTKHVAINDCLIDAYMMYFLKMKIDNFYL